MAEVTVSGSVQVIEVAADRYTLCIGTAPVRVVTAATQGPQGPPGVPGAGGATFVFVQAVPSTTWTINHNLGQWPSVTVVDSGGTVVLGTVSYVSVNTVVVTFTVGFGGVAYLN